MDMLNGGRGQSRTTFSFAARAFLLVIVIAGVSVTVSNAGHERGAADGHPPDLVVEDVFFQDGPSGHYAYVVVRNDGATTELSYQIRLRIDDVFERTETIDGISYADANRSLFVNVDEWFPGTRSIEATVDFGNAVNESNEANNQYAELMNVTSGPDLKVTGFSVTEASNGHVLRTTFENIGHRTRNPVTMEVVVPGVRDSNFTFATGVSAGASWARNLPLDRWLSDGFTAQAWVDRGNAMIESDESNNHLEQMMTPGTGPDIRMVNLSLGDVPVVLYAPVVATWEVRNVGTHETSGLGYELSVPGRKPMTGYGGAAPGEVRHVESSTFFPLQSGSQILRLALDPDGLRGNVTRGPAVVELDIEVQEPAPLSVTDIQVNPYQMANESHATVHVQATAVGDHVPREARFQVYDGDQLLAQQRGQIRLNWDGHGSPSTGFDALRNTPDENGAHRTQVWTTFEVPPPGHGDVPLRAVVDFDIDTAWQANGTGTAPGPVTITAQRHAEPAPAEPQYAGPTAPQPEPGRLVAAPEPPAPEPEPALPIALEVVHVDTDADPQNPGAHLLRFHVKALGPGGTSTDLGVIAKVGWQVQVLTSSHDLQEGDTGEYVLRLTPPENGSTSSTITVGAWAEAARAEPIVVNVGGLKVAGAAAGHPVSVWGYTTGFAVAAAAAGAFVWFAEPRRYGFLRYLLAMFPVVGGFSRIQGQKVLEHEARERIHQAIESQPGIHYRALLRELQMSNGRLAHHLQTLEREGIIRTESTAGKLHFYVTGSTAVRGTPLTDRQRALLAMIKKEPGILQSRLAERLGVSRQALHQHLDTLREQNLLLDARYGRTRALYLESDAQQRLTVCNGCQSFYDRGQGMVSGVVCPSCGQGS